MKYFCHSMWFYINILRLFIFSFLRMFRNFVYYMEKEKKLKSVVVTILKGKIALVTFRFLWNCEFILSFCAVITICITEDEIDFCLFEKINCTACSRGLWLKSLSICSCQGSFLAFCSLFQHVYGCECWSTRLSLVSQGLFKMNSVQ